MLRFHPRVGIAMWPRSVRTRCFNQELFASIRGLKISPQLGSLPRTRRWRGMPTPLRCVGIAQLSVGQIRPLPRLFHARKLRGMTDKQAVIDALHRLPENASLDQISQELRLMAAIRKGREDVVAGRSK